MTRRFELIAGSSAKFWEVTLEDLTLSTRYGRIGTSGQQTTKLFADNDQALRELERLVKEKIGKGYTEVGGGGHAPETVYLEHPQTRRFFEISEDNNHLRVRRGTLGSPCLTYHAPFETPGKARTQLERLVGEWQTNGFVVTQPLEPILDGSVAHSLYTDEIEDHPVYSQFFDLGWASDLRGEEGQRLFHFRDGLRVQGHFDLEEIADMSLEVGVIIEGDVVVSGVFSQLTYTYPNSTLITGSVRAQGLGHKDSFLRILGDVRVDNIIYGEYNDGQLEIEGTAYGVAWISADHGMSARHYEIKNVDEDYELLTPKVLNFEGGLEWDALREYLFANKNPLRKKFVRTPSTEALPNESPQPSALALEVQALTASEVAKDLTSLLETRTAQPNKTASMPPAVRQISPRRINADTRNALEEIKRLNKQANDAQTSNPSAALELFERAVAISSPYLPTFSKDDFVYDHLYTLQGRLWCVNELAQNNAVMIERAIKLAEEILEFTTGNANFYYSETGELMRSAETLAHNALAWYALQTGKNLPEALEHIDAASEGLDYTSQADAFTTVYENKVKILFALNRDDDAYGVIFQMRREYPDLEVFRTLAQTAAFQRWDAEN